jgi:PAS domain S-box-containing protein
VKGVVDDGQRPAVPNLLATVVANVSSGTDAGPALTGVEQQLLRTSERDLRSILDNVPDAVSVKGLDHCYRLVNYAFEARFGLRSGEVEGCSDDEILPRRMLAAERASDEKVLRTGDPVEREAVVDQDGEDRVHLTVKFALRDDDGVVCAVCTVLSDITERRGREAERRDRARWQALVRDAIGEDRLVLHGQPIIDLADGRVTQAELLVRMADRDPTAGLIAPGEFLPAAERFDVVAPIDLWVVARALELARQHRVEINLSGRTISSPEHVAEIERLVAASGAPPQNIIFEITETAVVENLVAARRFAERLGAAGCSFALDDFGVGFGTFTYLKHLPVDYLKIDIDFVRDLVRDEVDRHVVHAMVSVANGFGIRTIAEGVEDQATLELLTTMGVDFAQGFWTGRPGPIDKLWTQTTDRARTT